MFLHGNRSRWPRRQETSGGDLWRRPAALPIPVDGAHTVQSSGRTVQSVHNSSHTGLVEKVSDAITQVGQ